MAGQNQIRIGSSVRVAVPASSANLGPGFDAVGLALPLWDTVTASVSGEGVLVRATGEGADQVPTGPEHLVVRSMFTAWERLGVTVPPGLELLCENGIPHSRGLGSSAAAIVSGVAAAAALAGVDLTQEQGLGFVNDVAGDLEGHPDNSSASVFGGLTLSWPAQDRSGWETVRPVLHPDVRALALVPQERLATETARAALPQSVPHRDAARNSATTALLVHALTQDPALLVAATQDWLHQEQRRGAYPASMALVDRLRAQGYAATISGAGPSVLVLVEAGREQELRDAVAAEAGWRAVTGDLPRRGVQVLSQPSE
ncbi:homoserine kinase [Dermacoccaceae bacterium W4C1]